MSASKQRDCSFIRETYIVKSEKETASQAEKDAGSTAKHSSR